MAIAAEAYNAANEVVEATNQIFTVPLAVFIATTLTMAAHDLYSSSPFFDIAILDTALTVLFLLVPAGSLATAASVGDQFIRAKAVILNPVTSQQLVLALGPSLAQGYTDGLKGTTLGIQLFNILVRT